ncbi:MAG: alpha/beta hydrolase [Bryobacteraceae bacterium]
MPFSEVSKYVVLPLLGVWAYGLLYYTAYRATYHPLAYPEGYYEYQSKVGAQDVWLQSEDGIRLHAWWIEVPGARLATLFLHGNAGNLSHRLRRIAEITAAGSSLLLLDYRGFGKSEGRPSESGLYRDADAGYRHLIARGYKPERIVVHGESLGTAVAVDLAVRMPCAGLILESPFSSAGAVAAGVLPVLGPLVVRTFDSIGKIGRVRAPLLIVHGDRDEVIPLELGRALFDAAREPKQWIAVKGAGHNDLVEAAGTAYRDYLLGFYGSLRLN